MEKAISQIFTHKGIMLKVVPDESEGENCTACYFHNHSDCIRQKCGNIEREDGLNVMFKQIES